MFGYWLADPHIRERLGPVRLVLSGSAPLAASVIDQFTDLTGLPVHQGYGLTEAAPVVTSTLCSVDLQSGSVGAALPGIELRLVDDLGHAPEGEDPGEIQVYGDNLFSGYWPDGSGGPDDAGWWSTGDVGFLDATGDLFLVDRLKELVIVSGFNVYPSEVEDVVREVDGVTEVAVIGVDDDETGEAVVAYVARTGCRPAPRSRTPYARGARSGWPASSGRAGSRSSTSCRSPSPARSRRAGCAASSGGGRSGSWSDRGRPRHALRPRRAATCATTPARSSSGCAATSARSTTRSTSTPTRTSSGGSATRCR